MKRLVRIHDITLLAGAIASVGILYTIGCQPADACGLCSRGYRVYHSKPVVKVQKQVVERVVEKNHYIPQQTVIFNNAYPAAAPGNTSYQSFASAYAPSANGLIALASQQAEASSAVAALASQQAASEASLAALQIERDKIVAISEHLRAGLQGSGAGGGSQTLVLQIGADGSVRQVTPQQVTPDRAQQPLPQGSIIAEKCGKCHSGAQPKGEFYLDGQNAVSDSAFRLAVEKVATGEMPPASEPELSADEKSAILEELLSLRPEN